MEEKQLGGICIGARVWRENDKMLSVFCEDGFVYGVLARGALKPKYELKFAAQLFSYCDYFLCESKAGYYILGGATFGELSLLGISSDPDSYAAACVACEIAHKSVKSENKAMYVQTLSALGELAGGGARRDLIVLRMLICAFEYNGLGGLFPQGEKGDICKAVLFAEPGNVSDVCAETNTVRQLIKAFASKFAVQFGKLDSLEFFIGK